MSKIYLEDNFQALSKRIGSHIEKARPYYETLELTVKAQAECQKAAVQFQRAAGIHAAAKVGLDRIDDLKIRKEDQRLIWLNALTTVVNTDILS